MNMIQACRLCSCKGALIVSAIMRYYITVWRFRFMQWHQGAATFLILKLFPLSTHSQKQQLFEKYDNDPLSFGFNPAKTDRQLRINPFLMFDQMLRNNLLIERGIKWPKKNKHKKLSGEEPLFRLKRLMPEKFF